MWWIALVLAANPHLDEARKLYEQLKYPDAVARLRVARSVPNNTSEENQQIADLLARSLIAQGHTADAEKAWAELLVEQPDAPEPLDASPKIREVFLKAKRSVYPDDFVRLERGPAPPELLEATLLDPWHRVKSMALRCGDDVAVLPVARRISTRLKENVECTLQADDAGGQSIAQVTATHAKAAVVIAEAPPPAVEVAPAGPARWPAVLFGVLAVGAAATGAALGISAWQDYDQITAMTPAAPTFALDSSARSKVGGAWGALSAMLVTTALMLVFLLRS